MQDEWAAAPNPTTLENVFNLSWLNDILGLIKDLQAEIGVEILLEQVGSLEIVQFVTEVEGYLVAPIANPQNQESENIESENQYVDIEVEVARQPSPRD